LWRHLRRHEVLAWRRTGGDRSIHAMSFGGARSVTDAIAA